MNAGMPMRTMTFNDETSSEIQSDSIPVIKTNLTKKINLADGAIVLVGKDATVSVHILDIV